MRLLNYFTSASYRIFGMIMLVIGVALIVLAFINSPLQLQIAIGLMGLGFISLGLVVVKRVRNDARDEERFNQLIAKLDEIQQDLQKDKGTEGRNTVITDIISTGLKFYADRMSKSDDEEE
ncbi:hypothetical protein ACFLYL_04830 [Chloroflexota bacterium]